jgi:hypothetical protein
MIWFTIALWFAMNSLTQIQRKIEQVKSPSQEVTLQLAKIGSLGSFATRLTVRLAVGHGPGGATAYHCVSLGGIMIKEHDCVVLTSELPSEGLLSGDVGTVVHIHGNVAAYAVEFATLTGRTIAVATVLPSQCRPIGHRDINHVREVHAA